MSFHEMMAIGMVLGFMLVAAGGTMRFLTGNVPHPDFPDGGNSLLPRLLPDKWAERGVAIAILGLLLAIISIVGYFVVD